MVLYQLFSFVNFLEQIKPGFTNSIIHGVQKNAISEQSEKGAQLFVQTFLPCSSTL